MRGVKQSMTADKVEVFFYGLFMDESLLVSMGISPSSATGGYINGYGIRIGRRATLVPDEDNRAYGVLMSVLAEEVEALYSQESVADYVSESVSVVTADRTIRSAVCYNLPEDKVEGTNPEYAHDLLVLARKLGLPRDYLEQIERQGA